MTDDDAPQTAMLLTQTEWYDLVTLMGAMLILTKDSHPDPLLLRQRALAQRIIDAA